MTDCGYLVINKVIMADKKAGMGKIAKIFIVEVEFYSAISRATMVMSSA